MLSLEQLRTLESRVEKAVNLISSLRGENTSLREGLAAAETRINELEKLISHFQNEQTKIEEGIIDILRKLDVFEDRVHEKTTGPDLAGSKEAKAFEPSEPIQTRQPANGPDSIENPEKESPSGDGLDIF
ncbi:hypothetical protein MASR2M29_20140 [Spirochaetota bacterium]